ncbi:hypothetical protein EBL_c28070 [Shimwellia blattae DSM 4481 = NBRC 105725]|uniref:Uncharacterized protein n=1 Tax=Shimwellia blattae (strain ATCC 29907 / DSM 4481 / JCM 1650 / NBRC 105725 / CDC 9005-74) TaxID=630626 RepID=I2BBH4_SHIBC|nr:hypothetical protein EBL_c28070 [Shimwellia blattae DSM 4481 = NBRC 105725]
MYLAFIRLSCFPEHDSHQLSPAEQRAIERDVMDGIARASRYHTMISGPAYQWKKPAPRR